PGAELSWMDEVKKLEQQYHDIRIAMWGDYHKTSRDVEDGPAAGDRIETIVYQCWYSTSDPTHTQQQQYAIAQEEYAGIKKSLASLKAGIEGLEEKLNSKGVPYTPDRINFREE